MYTDHYGLTGQPFQLTPDARFWFESRTHQKAMAYLGYGLAQGEGFIVVTGEIGAGKSTLVAHLMATIDRARLNAISLVSTQVEGDDMLRLAAQGLGLETGGVEKAQLLDADRAAARRGAARRQAHPADRRRGAEPAGLGARRAAHAVQLPARRPGAAPDRPARPARVPRQARRRRALEQLRQRVIATHHLEAMDADEVEAYVRHRLAVVGWQGRPDFDARRLRRAPPPDRRHSAPASTSSPTGCCSMPRSRSAN